MVNIKLLKIPLSFLLIFFVIGFYSRLVAFSGESGTCCSQKNSGCWVEDSQGNLFRISDTYFQKGDGPCLAGP